MNTLVTGGAGFVGHHLVKKLVELGHQVTVLDSLLTGKLDNLKGLPVTFVHGDVIDPWPNQKWDLIYHLACPAAPQAYQANPIHTHQTAVLGTMNAVSAALNSQCRLIYTSTSEIYGTPLVSPQHEEYWGNTNPQGPRSCYDEGKRFSETVIYDHVHACKLDAVIVRLFNTYGPGMCAQDGRVIGNFVHQYANNQPLTIYGTGNQTRSFCYVSDTVEGLVKLTNAPANTYNLGNPREISIDNLYEIFCQVVEKLNLPTPKRTYAALPTDDPTQRQPNINRITRVTGWNPVVSIEQGLELTLKGVLDSNAKTI